MPHVTFIHGIANKPPSDLLLAEWLDALAVNGGPRLADMGVTTAMVYWADVMYEAPLDTSEGMAGLEAIGGGADALPTTDAATAPPPKTRSVEEAKAVVGLAAKFGAIDAMAAAESAAEGGLERIPLPGFITRPVMEAYLRDVHHYLFNAGSTPRPGGPTFAVQDEVRKRTLELLDGGSRNPGPHVVVGHSLGSVIAYDCLKRVPGCPAVDGLLTLGSPLGLDEVQDQLHPEWTRAEGFPSATLRGRWVNVYDRFDPVAGFDPKLANDFRQADQGVVEDINEQNFGRWRHDSTKYFRGAQLRAALLGLLNLPG